MIYATVLEINQEEIEMTLRESGVHQVEASTTQFKEYDMPAGKLFIPPIYRSRIFNRLFDKITKLSTLKLPLTNQSYHLLLISKDNHKEICLRSSVKAYGNIDIKITEPQYHGLARSLEAGGMKKVLLWQRNIHRFAYIPLQTTYTIYDWTHLSPFMHIKSPHLKGLIEALAMLGISLDRTVNFSLEEVHTYYGINFFIYDL